MSPSDCKVFPLQLLKASSLLYFSSTMLCQMVTLTKRKPTNTKNWADAAEFVPVSVMLLNIISSKIYCFIIFLVCQQAKFNKILYTCVGSECGWIFSSGPFCCKICHNLDLELAPCCESLMNRHKRRQFALKFMKLISGWDI